MGVVVVGYSEDDGWLLLLLFVVEDWVLVGVWVALRLVGRDDLREPVWNLKYSKNHLD